MIKIMRLAGALCAFGLMVVACGGGGEDTEDGSTGECSSDSDCKGDRVCSDGACVDPPSSNGGSTGTGNPPPPPPPGEDCSATGDSCASSGCCTEPTDLCVNYGGSLGTACGFECTYGNECQTGCCGSLQGGGGACAPVDYCDWMSPCEGDNYCASQVCIGFCSAYCGDSYDCASNGWCFESTGGSQYCYPSCDSNSDCAAGTSCQLYITVDNFEIYTCA